MSDKADDIKAENKRLANELHEARLLLAKITGRRESILDRLTRMRPRVRGARHAEVDDIISRVAHILDN